MQSMLYVQAIEKTYEVRELYTSSSRTVHLRHRLGFWLRRKGKVEQVKNERVNGASACEQWRSLTV